MTGARRYRRPDGAEGVASLSLALSVWSDGSVTSSLASWRSGERIRHYRLPILRPEGLVAPPGLEALALAADEVLDAWGRGELR